MSYIRININRVSEYVFPFVLLIIFWGYSCERVYDNPFDSKSEVLPDAPANVSMDVSNGQIELRWDSETDIVQYNIYRDTTQGVSTIKYAAFETTDTNYYLLHSIQNESSYYFIITAENQFGESPPSNVVGGRINLVASIITNDFGTVALGNFDYSELTIRNGGDIKIIGMISTPYKSTFSVVSGVKYNINPMETYDSIILFSPLNTWTYEKSIFVDYGVQLAVTGTGIEKDTLVTERFVDIGNGTIVDNLTNIIWTQDFNDVGASLTWEDALTCCDSLTLSGFSDWVLPPIGVLSALFNNGIPKTTAFGDLSGLHAGHPFYIDFDHAVAFWSSTEYSLGNAYWVSLSPPPNHEVAYPSKSNPRNAICIRLTKW